MGFIIFSIKNLAPNFYFFKAWFSYYYSKKKIVFSYFFKKEEINKDCLEINMFD